MTNLYEILSVIDGKTIKERQIQNGNGSIHHIHNKNDMKYMNKKSSLSKTFSTIKLFSRLKKFSRSKVWIIQ